NGNWLPVKSAPGKEELKILHNCIGKVQHDIQSMSYNTCVSAFMVAVNEFQKLKSNSQDVLEDLLKVIAPFAPHLCEELWESCGYDYSISTVSFPEFLKKYTLE